MSDHLTVILPPVLTAEERIEEALSYSSLTDGDGDGSGRGFGHFVGWGDGTDYGDGGGNGWGRGYGMHGGDGRSSTDV
jgi:hypothetical protein